MSLQSLHALSVLDKVNTEALKKHYTSKALNVSKKAKICQ